MQIVCLERLGLFEEASAVMKRQPAWGLPLDGDALCQAFRSGGQDAYWNKRLELLLALPENTAGSREYGLTATFCQLGRLDEAFQCMLNVIDRKTGMCVFLKVDPNMMPLHRHPRFGELVERIGIGK
jgi:hypothetical protein